MTTFLLLAFIAIVAIALLNAFVTVPAAHVGILTRFNGRVPFGGLLEGLHVKLPFIDKVRVYSLELTVREVTFSFTTQDLLNITISGKFQYRFDPNVVDEQGRAVFVAVSDEAIAEGIVEAIEARLGGLGGKHKYELFVENRQALGDIINSILRLSTPPHLLHDPAAPAPDPNWTPQHPGEQPPRFCGLTDCRYDREVKAEELIDFYNKHWRQIRIFIGREHHVLSDRSVVERRFGIDVEAFDIGNVDFTPETKKAFEEQKQAEARARAGDARIALANRFRTQLKGISPKDAADEADLVLDPEVRKNIISVQGETGILGGLLGFLGGQQGKKGR